MKLRKFCVKHTNGWWTLHFYAKDEDDARMRIKNKNVDLETLCEAYDGE